MRHLERLLYLVCILFLLFMVSRETSPRAALLTSFEDGFAGVVEKVAPVVVNISAEGVVNRRLREFEGTPFEEFFHDFFGPQLQQRMTSLGSGMIVRNDGYILTNAHVVRGMSKISVMLGDGTMVRNAKIVGTDPRMDLAVIQINSKAPLPQGILGDSDRLRVGSWAIAVGNPYGFNSSITVGVISAKGRNLPGQSDTTYHNLIQTDAPINPGNSGGPLVNLNGEIIGINTSIASPSGGSVGIGFAIPINTAKRELADLINKGKVAHGWLGVYMQPITPELSQAFGVSRGVVVAEIVPGSPASRAGLKRGDVILKFDGKSVESADELQDLVIYTAVGSNVKLEVMRQKNVVVVPVTIGEMPGGEENARTGAPLLGLHLRELTRDLAESRGLPEKSGLLVTRVDPDSLAEEARIAPGDIVVEVDNQPVGSVERFQHVIANHREGPLLVLIQHQGRFRFLVLNKPL